jgi:two-component system phosphate regulon sensor histidine kinase PhoR
VPETARALGDPDGVEQMVLNLVDNAVKYGRAGGQVRVTAARADGWIDISVSDDGPGIESRHLPRLFERFYRVDPGRSASDGGSGLGLAIVKNLAESMGGRVSVTSEVARGTRFTIRLPAAPPP